MSNVLQFPRSRTNFDALEAYTAIGSFSRGAKLCAYELVAATHEGSADVSTKVMCERTGYEVGFVRRAMTEIETSGIGARMMAGGMKTSVFVWDLAIVAELAAKVRAERAESLNVTGEKRPSQRDLVLSIYREFRGKTARYRVCSAGRAPVALPSMPSLGGWETILTTISTWQAEYELDARAVAEETIGVWLAHGPPRTVEEGHPLSFLPRDLVMIERRIRRALERRQQRESADVVELPITTTPPPALELEPGHGPRQILAALG